VSTRTTDVAADSDTAGYADVRPTALAWL